MTGYLTFSDQDAQSRFPTHPFATRNALSDHPLLQLPALAGLARELEPGQIEYCSGNQDPDQVPDEVRGIDLPAQQVIEEIEHCGAWLVLKNVEIMPEYRLLLQDILRDGAREAGFASLEEAGMTDIQGFIFVASANSVTPFHADDEDNLFVHLHGRKFFHVIDNQDRSLVPDADLEAYPGKHRNLRYRPEFEERATVYDLSPGDGIFVPYLWPHWVRTGDDYSISMQVTWRSPAVARLNRLSTANAIMRTLGLPQPAPGKYPIWDNAKVGAYSLARAALEPLRRSQRGRQWIHGLFQSRHRDEYFGSNG